MVFVGQFDFAFWNISILNQWEQFYIACKHQEAEKSKYFTEILWEKPWNIKNNKFIVFQRKKALSNSFLSRDFYEKPSPSKPTCDMV